MAAGAGAGAGHPAPGRPTSPAAAAAAQTSRTGRRVRSGVGSFGGSREGRAGEGGGNVICTGARTLWGDEMKLAQLGPARRAPGLGRRETVGRERAAGPHSLNPLGPGEPGSRRRAERSVDVCWARAACGRARGARSGQTAATRGAAMGSGERWALAGACGGLRGGRGRLNRRVHRGPERRQGLNHWGLHTADTLIFVPSGRRAADSIGSQSQPGCSPDRKLVSASP